MIIMCKINSLKTFIENLYNALMRISYLLHPFLYSVSGRLGPKSLYGNNDKNNFFMNF